MTTDHVWNIGALDLIVCDCIYSARENNKCDIQREKVGGCEQ